MGEAYLEVHLSIYLLKVYDAPSLTYDILGYETGTNQTKENQPRFTNQRGDKSWLMRVTEFMGAQEISGVIY